jgi:hypothetical protein
MEHGTFQPRGRGEGCRVGIGGSTQPAQGCCQPVMGSESRAVIVASGAADRYCFTSELCLVLLNMLCVRHVQPDGSLSMSLSLLRHPQAKVRPSGACNTGAASLCAPRTSAADDSALLLATSPEAFDLRDPKQIGGFKVLTPVLDQLECNTCTAFAVGAAAGATDLDECDGG